jgi:threonine/homoserine/homoserine lactone efflux protein
MTTGHALLAFAAAAGLLTVTPGMDTALVLRTAAVEGPRRAMQAARGICLGCLTWGLAASLGLGALLAVSHAAYNVLRIGGACYLIYLGVRMFFRAQSSFAFGESSSQAPEPEDTKALRPGSTHSGWFARGFLTNLLNPKVGVFYVTFLPQFVPAGVPVVSFSMLLALVHAVEGILWLSAIIRATKLFSKWFQLPSVSRSLDRVTGTVLTGFGLELILDRRH